MSSQGSRHIGAAPFPRGGRTPTTSASNRSRARAGGPTAAERGPGPGQASDAAAGLREVSGARTGTCVFRGALLVPRAFPVLAEIRVFESPRTLRAAPRHPGTGWEHPPPLGRLPLRALRTAGQGPWAILGGPEPRPLPEVCPGPSPGVCASLTVRTHCPARRDGTWPLGARPKPAPEKRAEGEEQGRGAGLQARPPCSPPRWAPVGRAVAGGQSRTFPSPVPAATGHRPGLSCGSADSTHHLTPPARPPGVSCQGGPGGEGVPAASAPALASAGLGSAVASCSTASEPCRPPVPSD